MEFLLLGATGTTGLQFIDLALAAGHEVVAMVRNREKLQERQGLHIVAGNVLSTDAVAAAAQGVDAIVTASLCIVHFAPRKIKSRPSL